MYRDYDYLILNTKTEIKDKKHQLQRIYLEDRVIYSLTEMKVFLDVVILKKPSGEFGFLKLAYETCHDRYHKTKYCDEINTEESYIGYELDPINDTSKQLEEFIFADETMDFTEYEWIIEEMLEEAESISSDLFYSLKRKYNQRYHDQYYLLPIEIDDS